MGKPGDVPAHGLVNRDLPERVAQMVVTANDVGDVHVVIIDHDGQHIGRRIVSAQQHEIIDLGGVDFHASLDAVFDDAVCAIGGPQADNIGRVCRRGRPAIAPGRAERRQQGARFGQQRAAFGLAEALLARASALFFAEVAPGLKLFCADIAAECRAARHHLMRHSGMAAHALGLHDRRLVRCQAEPVHGIEDRRRRLRRGAFVVGIFDAQQEPATMPFREKVVEKRGACPSDVKHPGGGRGKPRNDAHDGGNLRRFGGTAADGVQKHEDERECKGWGCPDWACSRAQARR